MHFEDGTFETGVDHVLFGTGFTWTLPFLPQVPVRNNRVPDLYQHVFWRHDPTLCFVGAVRYHKMHGFTELANTGEEEANNRSQVGAGLTFKVFEWQAVAAARVLARRASLPSVSNQENWESERIAEKGDGPAFTLINPEFKAYFEELRALAGEPGEGVPGRRLPVFEQKWVDDFEAGHERRKKMWRRANIAAAEL